MRSNADLILVLMKYRLLLFALLSGCAAQEIYMMSSEWSRWSPWSFCSGGVRVRVRACATVRGFKCIGHNKEFQSCDLATTTSSPSEGKTIDDPFLEDRSAAMKQLYPDYDQPFKPQSVKVSTTEGPFFKNNQLLERLRENDSLAALINRAATVSPSSSSPSPSHSTRSSPPPPILAPSQEEYEDEEMEEESSTTVSPSTRLIPEIRVATVTTKPTRVTSQLQRKRPIDTPSTTVLPNKEKEALESLEHYEDGEVEEGSEYEEPSEGDEGGEKREEKEGKSMERNKIVAAASKIVTEKERVREEDEEKEIGRRRENERREHLRHKVDGGDDDLPLSSPLIKRKDLQNQSSQINHIPVKMSTSDPFEEDGIHSRLLNVEVEMKDAEKKSRRDLEFTLKNVNGIIEKLEYEARFRATQGSGLTPLQHAYLKRSRDIRSQLVELMDRKNTTTHSPTTTTQSTTTSTSPPSTPPEPLNPKIAEDTVRALDWLMENMKDRLEPEGITVTSPTTSPPKKILRHRTRRPSYMKGVRFIENGEEIHPHPVRLRTHSIPSQRSYRLPSSSIRTFGSDSVDGKTDDEVMEIEPIPLLTPTQPVRVPTTPRPRPVTILPVLSPSGIEPIIGTDWEPFEWSEWSDWSECVCGWQLRKRICIPHSEEVQCPAPEYQRRKCEGGSCKQRAALH